MKNRKKSGKKSGVQQDKPSQIRFELEPDAEEISLNHLKQFKPEKGAADTDSKPSKKSNRAQRINQVHEIDLHGFTLAQASVKIRSELDELRQMAGAHRIKIITGKGHHSHKGEGVLAKEIHNFVLQVYRQFILEIEESPDSVRLDGVLLRGHFHLTLLGHLKTKDKGR